MISQFYSSAETQRARRDSNPQPSDPKSDALSIELRALLWSSLVNDKRGEVLVIIPECTSWSPVIKSPNDSEESL